MQYGTNVIELPMNARNTQFGALYMPQHDLAYEPEVGALLDLLLDPGDGFLDIGANWGYFALYVLSRPAFAGQVHAIEPHPSTFDDLAAIAEKAGFADRLTCHQIALSDQDGEATLFLHDGVQSGLARLSGFGPGARVPLRRLDRLLADAGRPPVSVVKMDVEGHEAAVLRGARELISRREATFIMENWLERQSPEITLDPLGILADHGYRLFQPVWLISGPSGIHAVDGRLDPGKAEHSSLGLIEFDPQERFLLGDQINVVACPEPKLGWLRSRFVDQP